MLGFNSECKQVYEVRGFFKQDNYGYFGMQLRAKNKNDAISKIKSMLGNDFFDKVCELEFIPLLRQVIGMNDFEESDNNIDR